MHCPHLQFPKLYYAILVPLWQGREFPWPVFKHIWQPFATLYVNHCHCHSYSWYRMEFRWSKQLQARHCWCVFLLLPQSYDSYTLSLLLNTTSPWLSDALGCGDNQLFCGGFPCGLDNGAFDSGCSGSLYSHWSVFFCSTCFLFYSHVLYFLTILRLSVLPVIQFQHVSLHSPYSPCATCSQHSSFIQFLLHCMISIPTVCLL